MNLPPPTPSRGLTIGILIISGFGILLMLLGGGLMLLLGVGGIADSSLGTNIASFGMTSAWTALLGLCFVIPTFLYAVNTLRGKEYHVPQLKNPLRIASLALFVWPVVVALGAYVSASETLISYLVLPPLQILSIGLPLWWLVEFGRRKLQSGSAHRGLSLVTFSMVVTMPLTIVLEIVLVGVVLILGVFWLASQPGMADQLNRLAVRLGNSDMDPRVISRIIQPYLRQTGIILSGLAMIAVLVPMVEEWLKPLGLWFLSGRKMTAAEGFAAGLISGAIFALLESLSGLSAPLGSDWIGLVIGRTGTGLLHITTAGLVGYGLGAAWNEGKYLRLGGLFLAAVAIHGSWNATAVLMSLSGAVDPQSGIASVAQTFAELGPLFLVLLVLGMFVILYILNHHLQPKVEPTPWMGVPGVYQSPSSYPQYDPMAYPTISPVSEMPQEVTQPDQTPTDHENLPPPEGDGGLNQ